MSDKESNDANSNAQSQNNDTGASSIKMPSSIKEAVQMTVESTNQLLAKMETSVSSLKEPVCNTWKTVEEHSAVYVHQAKDLYEHRLEYGPALVAGTGLTFGAVTALRRGGRIFPTTMSALIGSGLAFGVVYGALDEVTLPSSWTDLFPKKRD